MIDRYQGQLKKKSWASFSFGNEPSFDGQQKS
jgi:hypothetical protein